MIDGKMIGQDRIGVGMILPSIIFPAFVFLRPESGPQPKHSGSRRVEDEDDDEDEDDSWLSSVICRLSSSVAACRDGMMLQCP